MAPDPINPKAESAEKNCKEGDFEGNSQTFPLGVLSSLNDNVPQTLASN